MSSINSHLAIPTQSSWSLGLISFSIAPRLARLTKTEVAVASIALTLFGVYLTKKITQTDWQHLFLKWYRQRPDVVQKMEAAKREMIPQLEKDLFGEQKGPVYNTLVPTGLSEKAIFSRWENDNKTPEWQKGKVSGTVYHRITRVKEVVKKAFGLSLDSNPMHAETFPHERRCKAEIVQMTSNLFHGGPEGCGVLTSGGTESLILAVRAAVKRGIDEFGIQKPEMIIPVTAHAAFSKAVDLMLGGVTLIEAPVDPETFQVDVKAVKKLITKNTVLLVGSFPEFCSGAIDPIEELSAIVLDPKYKTRICLHVDACLGGFLLPFMEKAGYKLPLYDFRVPGVTSISIDTHKYGYGPKGSSVLLFRNRDYRKHVYFKKSRWPGGLWCTPTIAGSHSGAIIAGSWAAMLHIGEKDYIEYTKSIIETAEKLVLNLRNIKEIKVMGSPKISVIGIQSADPSQLNIFHLYDELKKKGWTLSSLQRPDGFHICLTQVHASLPEFIPNFIQDLREGIEAAMKKPVTATKEGTARIYGETQKIPSQYADEFLEIYLDTVGQTEAKVYKN